MQPFNVILGRPDITGGQLLDNTTICFSFYELFVMASRDHDWEHVSVSTAYRIPTWDEMEVIAKICFKQDEYAYQLHVPESEHINHHPYCLHWWRPRQRTIPLPPTILVGPKR